MTRIRSNPFIFMFLLLPLLLSSCASESTPSQPTAPIDTINDPMEPLNRTVFDVNDFLDRLLFRPLAELYRITFPELLRQRVTDVLLNMKEPVILVNNLLQGNLTKAGTTVERFSINTTLGLAGLWDVAGPWADLPQQTGDFGQTLYVWGFGEGPYTVLPLLGPSNLRDKVGLVVDTLLSPWQYFALASGPAAFNAYEITYFGTNLLVKREKNIESIDALRQGSLDFYAEMRSAYHQHRAQQIGSPPETSMPNFDDDEQDSSSSH